jgi:ferredoxin
MIFSYREFRILTINKMFFRRAKSRQMLFLPSKKEVPVGSAANILDLALKNKIPIDNSCGGSGSCGTCRIRIVQGNEKLAPMNFVEEAMAKAREFSKDERLACQTEPIADLIVFVPNTEDSED